MGGTEERYSIGLFAFTHGTLEIPEEFVDDEHPLQFKPFNQQAFLDYCDVGEAKIPGAAVRDFCGI